MSRSLSRGALRPRRNVIMAGDDRSQPGLERDMWFFLRLLAPQNKTTVVFFCPRGEKKRVIMMERVVKRPQKRKLTLLKKWLNNLGLHPHHLPTHSCLHYRNRTCCAVKWHFEFHLDSRETQLTLKMQRQVWICLRPYDYYYEHEHHWVNSPPVLCFLSPLQLHPPPFIIFYSTIPSHFPIFSSSSSIYHALVSCYSLTLSSPLPPLQYFILPLSNGISTPALKKPRLHSSYISSSSSPITSHRPLAAILVFIILIINLIISPTVPEVQYLYV